MRYYDSTHPMLVKQSGDPARGEWVPKSLKPKKGKR
jgi:hypothetical protein